jgi:hypothetical protein
VAPRAGPSDRLPSPRALYVVSIERSSAFGWDLLHSSGHSIQPGAA